MILSGLRDVGFVCAIGSRVALDMALELTRFDDVDAFEERAEDFLLESEAEHNLILGICGQIREGRYSDPYLSVVTDDERIVAAAVRTPPHNVLLSHLEDIHALEVIARDAHERFGASVPGVLGAKDDARHFAGFWTTLTMQRATPSMQQRIYQATHVEMPDGVAGELRPATPDDRALLIEWHRAFNEEALGATTHDGVEANVDFRLDPSTSSGLFMWWHADRPVAMVGYGRPTPSGMAVAPVYTPPELRGRGYASACTAEVTQHLLDGGRRFVFLYTDLSNPTSNSIYQKIGYRPVCDVDQYRFE
jgi:predicted GNAT family acetyltransferase